MASIYQTGLALLEIARPKQWVKNAFLFAPLIFAKDFLYLESNFRAGLAFVLFCLFSSCVYMLNDIADLERDREHPEKCKRPLPSGRLNVSTVAMTLAFLLIGCSVVAYWLSPQFLGIAYTYIVMNILYSFYWKTVVILDCMIIAAGFVLRAYAGAVVIGATFSDWLYICATFISLFLAFSKRRHEIILLGDDKAKDHRAILAEYSIPLLDQIISIVTAATIVTYALYCIDTAKPLEEYIKHAMINPSAPEIPTHENMKYTLPFVIYGVFRYLYLVYRKKEGGNPTELLLSDPHLIINGFIWLGVVFWALNFN
jgi:4-hydroxybenzoate polyprenyltransferase